MKKSKVGERSKGTDQEGPGGITGRVVGKGFLKEGSFELRPE